MHTLYTRYIPVSPNMCVCPSESAPRRAPDGLGGEAVREQLAAPRRGLDVGVAVALGVAAALTLFASLFAQDVIFKFLGSIDDVKSYFTSVLWF